MEDKSTVNRPWGWFRQYVINDKCSVKVHTVKKGKACSLQSHTRRAELFVPLDEGIVVDRDGENIEARPGEEIYIPVGARHRFTATKMDGRILEICFGHFDEDDIIRHEDRYGRVEKT